MRRWPLAAAALAAASALSANSHVPWLGGTLPYETTPYFELDPRLGYEMGDSFSAFRGELDAGIADFASLSVIGLTGNYSYVDANGQSRQANGSAAQAALRLRAAQAGEWPLDFGAFFKAPLSVWHTSLLEYGLIIGKDLGDFELALNAGYSGLEGLKGRVALLSPFLFPTFRLAAQYEFSDHATFVAPWFAEFRISLPGDIDVQLGGSFHDVSGLKAAVRVSYQIFEDPE